MNQFEMMFIRGIDRSEYTDRRAQAISKSIRNEKKARMIKRGK